MVISQKTPSGKSVFNIVCDEKHGGDAKDVREDDLGEAPGGSTEETVQEEAPGGTTEETVLEEAPEATTEEAAPEKTSEGTTEEAVQEKSTEGTTEESPQETGQNPPNRKESYILKDGKWLDLTSKAAYDVILGSEKKYVGDADIYDNLPIKAYLEDAGQAAYPDPAADIAVGSMPGSNSKLVLFKLKGRVEEWDTNPEFTWTSSDTGIFTVETADPEEGVMQITGISPGTAYLTIASEEMGTRVIGVTVQ